jgi:nucleoside-diphosphate-sugar epimerase
MKILICGIDGYIGYPLSIHLLKRGHEVHGLDNLTRRERVKDIGSDSLTPITSYQYRIDYTKHSFSNFEGTAHISLGNESNKLLSDYLNLINPDCIIHLAEMPSAPWSMIDAIRANQTQHDNVIGTLNLLWAMKNACPSAHLLKLGTMGEYGTPNCDIPEGVIPRRCISNEDETDIECPMHSLPFPRTPGSFYHLSKVHDTYNIIFACRNWGFRSTDIMQGVVFGLAEDLGVLTRFDYDEYFGTVINRFCAQAIIEHPLTVYGNGSQTRGFLPLKDSIKCLTIAAENPPELGEYRTLNQFENIYSINTLADMVCESARSLGLHVGINHLVNPRNEAENHYYNPTHQKLFNLGYVPTTDIQIEITKLINQLLPYKDRVIKEVIMPKTTWR